MRKNYSPASVIAWLMTLLFTSFANIETSFARQPYNTPEPVEIELKFDGFDLRGEWLFAFDDKDVGVKEKWFNSLLKGEATVKLPGIADSAESPEQPRLPPASNFLEIREKLTGNATHGFYCGKAWYQKEIIIREEDIKKFTQLELFLERSKVTSVWFDSEQITPTCYSISVPQRHLLTNKIKAGKHRITILVDNTSKLYQKYSNYYPKKLQSDWNGILGNITIHAATSVRLKKLRILPDFQKREIQIETTVSQTGENDKRIAIRPIHFSGNYEAMTEEFKFISDTFVSKKTIPNDDKTNFSQFLWIPPSEEWKFRIELEPKKKGQIVHTKNYLEQAIWRMGVWSEKQTFRTEETTPLHAIYIRKITSNGKQFFLNGKPLFLRGRNDVLTIPATGTMPMDSISWENYFTKCKDLGINHIRFTSVCPPRAAFEVADRLKMYLQVDVTRNSFLQPEGKDLYDCALETAYAILDEYGNYASFLFLGLEREMFLVKGLVVDSVVEELRQYDHNRRIFLAVPTGMYDNWSSAVSFYNHKDKAALQEFLAPHIETGPASTLHDYKSALYRNTPTTVIPEIKPYSIYPDLNKIGYRKKTLAPNNYKWMLELYDEAHAEIDSGYPPINELSGVEKFQEKVIAQRNSEKKTPRWKLYSLASLKTAFLCYKEAIESVLRTPGIGGYFLGNLEDEKKSKKTANSLFDFPVERNPFDGFPKEFESEWRQFCAPVVPLARFEKYTYNEGTVFTAEIQVANHSTTSLENVTVYTSLIGNAFNETRDEKVTLPAGKVTTAYTFFGPDGDGALATYDDIADLMTLEVRVLDNDGKEIAKNSWKIWVYPFYSEAKFATALQGIHVTSDAASARRELDKGGRVLLLNPPFAAFQNLKGMPTRAYYDSLQTYLPFSTRKGVTPEDFAKNATTSVHAVRGMFEPASRDPFYRRNGYGKTQGLLVDAKHPIFANFPTDIFGDWQWWNLIHTSYPHVLTKLAPTSLFPIAQVVNPIEKLGLIYEARSGANAQGYLLVCAMDETTLRKTPEGRHLLACLAAYMRSPAFAPAHIIRDSIYK